MVFRLSALRSAMGRRSVPDDAEEIVEGVEDGLDAPATSADIDGLQTDLAELKAWLARQMLITLCILILIVTIAVAASKAIP